AFPQPNRAVLARPQNCGFDVSGRAVLGGVPTDFGYWSGPAFALTSRTPDIQPYQGAGMLQFFEPAGGEDSEVWQLIDLHPFKRSLTDGLVEARLTSMFNRLRADALSGDSFRLSLAAFTGRPTDPKSLWAQRASAALVIADKEIITDNDP